jgi:hypothetical protein
MGKVMVIAHKHHYHPTESKYKDGAKDMFITYDLRQRTRGGGTAMYPKIKRVYIAGDVKDWKLDHVRKKSGREVYGVRIEYHQSRKVYRRKAFTAKHGKTAYKVSPASILRTSQPFVQVVHFYTDKDQLPGKYQSALQDVW